MWPDHRITDLWRFGEPGAAGATVPAGPPSRARMSGTQVAPIAADSEMVADDLQGKSLSATSHPAPDDWLDEIAALHQRGRELTARRELGMFLADYPGYRLPRSFPLQADEAIPAAIIPDAGDWLREIARLAEQGNTDRARMQLAEFLDYYPDHPLPTDFPLRREDAVIER